MRLRRWDPALIAHIKQDGKVLVCTICQATKTLPSLLRRQAAMAKDRFRGEHQACLRLPPPSRSGPPLPAQNGTCDYCGRSMIGEVTTLYHVRPPVRVCSETCRPR